MSVDTVYVAESATEISSINEKIVVAFETLPEILVPSTERVFVFISTPCNLVSW